MIRTISIDIGHVVVACADDVNARNPAHKQDHFVTENRIRLALGRYFQTMYDFSTEGTHINSETNLSQSQSTRLMSSGTDMRESAHVVTHINIHTHTHTSTHTSNMHTHTNIHNYTNK